MRGKSRSLMVTFQRQDGAGFGLGRWIKNRGALGSPCERPQCKRFIEKGEWYFREGLGWGPFCRTCAELTFGASISEGLPPAIEEPPYETVVAVWSEDHYELLRGPEAEAYARRRRPGGHP